jgi:hypothetical protein
MMPGSRSRTWAQWLGWTVVFAVVAWASGLAYVRLPVVPPALGLIFLVPPLAAAFLIGTRFPSWWWVAGPPLVLLVFSLAGSPLLLMLVLPAGALLPESMWSSGTFAVVFVVMVTFLLVLHALAAGAGVRRGRTR